MGVRSGSADLPLHRGQVPPWFAARTARLGRLVVEVLVREYGRLALLLRLAAPAADRSGGLSRGR